MVSLTTGYIQPVPGSPRRLAGWTTDGQGNKTRISFNFDPNQAQVQEETPTNKTNTLKDKIVHRFNSNRVKGQNIGTPFNVTHLTPTHKNGTRCDPVKLHRDSDSEPPQIKESKAARLWNKFTSAFQNFRNAHNSTPPSGPRRFDI